MAGDDKPARGGRSWIAVLAAGRVSDVLLTLLTLNMLARPITGGWIFTKMGLPAPPVGVSVALWALFVAFRAAARQWHPGVRRELLDAVWQLRFELGKSPRFVEQRDHEGDVGLGHAPLIRRAGGSMACRSLRETGSRGCLDLGRWPPPE